MPNSYRKRLVPLMAILGIAACYLLGVGIGTASAGTNGQKINYYNRHAYGQCTTGMNQNGETVQNCTQLRIGSNPAQDYWWVGQVRITWYYTDNSYAPTTCKVPRSQDGDYVTCRDPI